MRGTGEPDHIGRFRVVAELGRGAMGRVYLAEDPRIGRKIALKVLAQNEGLDEEQQAELRERFIAEARAAGSLSHPGIVTVFDADTDPASGRPYLVMEWVDGRPLSQILSEEGALEIPRVVDLVSQVAAALDHAHRQHVVHRDIKPANLLVTAGNAVKVTDFGIAKLRSHSLTLTGQMIGTPYYMSPEQIRGEPVDGRADLFALGVVLYECLTGEVAFHGDTLANITHKILRVDPRPAAMLNAAIPQRLLAVLDRALEKRAEDRFQTGEELEGELRAAIGDAGGGISPRGTALATAVAAPAKRHLEGSTVSLTPVAAAAVRSVKEPRAARARPGRFRRLVGLAALLFLLPLLATLVRRNLEALPPERVPEWLADAPPWMNELPGWMKKGLERIHGLTGWMDGVADQLGEVPQRLVAEEEREPPTSTPLAAPAATPAEPPREPSAYELWPIARGPVPPERPQSPDELLDFQDLVPGPVPPWKADDSTASKGLSTHG